MLDCFDNIYTAVRDQTTGKPLNFEDEFILFASEKVPVKGKG